MAATAMAATAAAVAAEWRRPHFRLDPCALWPHEWQRQRRRRDVPDNVRMNALFNIESMPCRGATYGGCQV